MDNMKYIEWATITLGIVFILVSNIWILVKGELIVQNVIPHTIANLVAGTSLIVAYFVKR